jgi:hypothetical protein
VCARVAGRGFTVGIEEERPTVNNIVHTGHRSIQEVAVNHVTRSRDTVLVQRTPGGLKGSARQFEIVNEPRLVHLPGPCPSL